MADLILDVDYNITQAEAKQRKLDREFQLSQQKADNIKKEIARTKSNIEESTKRQKDFNAELDRSAQKLDAYLHGQAEMSDKQLKAEMRTNEQLQKKIAKEESYRQSQERSLSKQNLQLDTQNAKTASIGDKIFSNTKKQNKFTQAFAKTTKSADRFGRRLKSLIASALFFSVVTKAFTALRNEFGKLINETGTKTASLVAQLNNNLAVLGRILYESARPAIEWILEKLVQITKVLTVGLAKILGKNVDQMKQLTKETKKAGKEAEKTTAGFDTIQTIGGPNSEAGNQTNNQSNLQPDTSKITDEIAILTAIISGALLVLGVILVFTGANIPLGLGLIALGAVGLAATYAAKWDTMKDETKGTIAGILAIGGALFILLGLALILTGAGIPLGIGLILLGAGMLYAAYKLTPGDSFTEKIKKLWSNVKKLTKTFLTWWTEKVINKVFGKGMGDSLKDMYDSFIHLFEDIINFFEGVFTGDWDKAWKSLVNILIDILNIIISNLNLTIQSVLGGGCKLINLIGKAFDKDWNLNADWAKIPKIPRLATGAILPGGSPMLAWVNDQPKGQTYVEGSIENIAAAFEKYLGSKGFGNQNITIEAKGNWAQFIKWLNLQIKEENKRATIWG